MKGVELDTYMQTDYLKIGIREALFLMFGEPIKHLLEFDPNSISKIYDYLNLDKLRENEKWEIARDTVLSQNPNLQSIRLKFKDDGLTIGDLIHKAYLKECDLDQTNNLKMENLFERQLSVIYARLKVLIDKVVAENEDTHVHIFRHETTVVLSYKELSALIFKQPVEDADYLKTLKKVMAKGQKWAPSATLSAAIDKNIIRNFPKARWLFSDEARCQFEKSKEEGTTIAWLNWAFKHCELDVFYDYEIPKYMSNIQKEDHYQA